MHCQRVAWLLAVALLGGLPAPTRADLPAPATPDIAPPTQAAAPAE